MTAAVRLLLESGLCRPPGRAGDQVLDGLVTQLRSLSRLVTATLIASEEASLAVQSVIWSEDDERLVGLRARATSAARQQIAELESAEGEL
jgi:predicted regulator of Ras-like GTPase activity (Roadblock/LC7/MglB family)